MQSSSETLTREPGLQNKNKIQSFLEQCEDSGSVSVSPKSPDALVSPKSTTNSPKLSHSFNHLLADVDKREPKLKEDSIDSPEKLLTDQRFHDQNSIIKDGSNMDECFKENTYLSPLSLPSEEIRNVTFTELADFQRFLQAENEVTPGSPKTLDTSKCHMKVDKTLTVPATQSSSILKSLSDNWEEIGNVKRLHFHVDTFESITSLKTTTDIFPSMATNSQSEWKDMTEEEDHTTGILQIKVFDESEVMFKQTSSMSNQDTALQTQDFNQMEMSPCEEVSSQPLSDKFHKTITPLGQFSTEDLIPNTFSEDADTTSGKENQSDDGQPCDNCNSPLDDKYLASRSNSVSPEPAVASSTSLGGHRSSPGKADVCTQARHTPFTSEYFVGVCNHQESPTLQSSDQENYFDCNQPSSDFSEMDPDEPDTQVFSSRRKHSLRGPDMGQCSVFLSSGSEEYEDAFFIHEPFDYSKNEEVLNNYAASDEEFHLCETSRSPCVPDNETFDDTDKSLAREISAELGSVSESSDDEFLTTRIVRRRVVIQSDELVDLPAESVTEEQYRNENGHLVVKKVTRKIIRKCVSADGVEHDKGTFEGNMATAEGAGYSKVFKRTVLRSEGDHTEVTLAEFEGSSSSSQELPEGCRITHTEETTVVDGVRTVTHQGDPTLASDLPSAQDDFKQALGYVNDFSRAELPHVVESEIVREDGTVVHRAHMHKGQTFSQTVLKEAGQPKQVLVEQMKNPGEECEKPRDLRQHLHQLFHHFYNEGDKVAEEESNLD